MAHRALLNSLTTQNDGSIAPLFALMWAPMFFAIGMSVDYSRVVAVERSVQYSLDAAALSAMQSETVDPQVHGLKFFNANFHSRHAQDPIVLFTKLEDGSVRATASISVPTTFAALMGVNTLQVETHSVVEPAREVVETTETTVVTSNIPCLHVMDQSGAYTFDLDGNEQIDARNCFVKVRSNSNDAVRGRNSTNVKFKKIRVKGGGSLDGGMTTVAGGLAADSQVVANPYEASIRDVVQALSIGNCTNSNTNKTLSGNVNPGTYCGTTEFKDATFAAGLYIIKSGSGNKVGRLKITGDIDGSAGVTFFLADNKAQIASYSPDDGSVLKAPATGTTRGILFFESSNRGANWSLDLNICKENSWEGLVYLPSADVEMNFEDWDHFKVSMAVNRLYMKDVVNLEWQPFAWTPFNMTTPITLEGEDEETTTTTSTTSMSDIYLRE